MEQRVDRFHGVIRSGDTAGEVGLTFTGSDDVPLVSVPLSGPEVGALLDLRSILGDLAMVQRYCDLYEASSDDYEQAAFYEAAVISYGRSFTGGASHGGRGSARRRVPDDVIERLPVELAEVHRQVKTERDKHVGHRVDPEGEQAKIGAISSTDPERFVAIVVFAARRAGAEVAPLRRLAEHLHMELSVVYLAEARALTDSVASSDRWRPGKG